MDSFESLVHDLINRFTVAQAKVKKLSKLNQDQALNPEFEKAEKELQHVSQLLLKLKNGQYSK